MAKAEIGSFTDGLFVPDGGGWSFKKRKSSERQYPSGLSSQESSLFDTVGKTEATHPLANMIDRALHTIVSEEMGVDVASPDPRRRAAQRLLITAIVSADSRFDTERDRFSDVAQEGADPFFDSFTNAQLHNAPESVSVKQALQVFEKVIEDPDLYSADARDVLRTSTDALFSTAIDTLRRDAVDLDAGAAQRVKETTNGVYAQLLFDTLYAPYSGEKGYGAARERFVATRLALQTVDDALDVGEDLTYGNANLFVAHANESGELGAMGEIYSKEETIFSQDPEQAIHSLQERAPRAYRRVVDRQHDLLETAALPQEVAQKLLLPQKEGE